MRTTVKIHIAGQSTCRRQSGRALSSDLNLRSSDIADGEERTW